MVAAGGDGGYDPFEMTFFGWTNVVYPSFLQETTRDGRHLPPLLLG